MKEATDPWRPVTLDEVKLAHIQRVLEYCDGRVGQAAKILGIGRTSLYRYLKKGSLKSKKKQSEANPNEGPG